MFTAEQYRAKAAEYSKLVRTANGPNELREFQALERSFAELADNAQWAADDHDQDGARKRARSRNAHARISSTEHPIDAALNMTRTGAEVAAPAGEGEEHPLPSDPKAMFLGGVFAIALLATAYIGSEIVLQLVFAIVSQAPAAASLALSG